MTERRQVDRDLAERVARLDEKFESIIAILAGHKETAVKIENDVHRVRELMEQRDDRLLIRIEALEAKNRMEEGGFKAIRFMLWLIGGAMTLLGVATGFFKDLIHFLDR